MTVKNKILFLIIILNFTSCVIFKTHHKKNLINFENNTIINNPLKLNGYFYREFELEKGENQPYWIDEYIKKTGINKIKYISAIFIYEDGFVIDVGGINGIDHYYCAEKKIYENTFENAHQTLEKMLEAQNSFDKKIKRSCGFNPNDINAKGLIEVKENNIKMQLYRLEMQNPTKDSFNSAYLYESNGIINSDTSFTLISEKEFRTNKTTNDKYIYKFRETKQKPNVENYFKKNRNQFN